MRTIVDLPDGQIEALDVWCQRDGLSRAEAVRRAVAAYIGQARAAGPDPAFGLWAGRIADGLIYERRLRDEWANPRVSRPKRAVRSAGRRK